MGGYDLSAMDQGGAYKDCGLSDGSVPCRVDDYVTFDRSEEHTSELQSLMRISYAVFCLKKKTHNEYKRLAKRFSDNTLLTILQARIAHTTTTHLLLSHH